MLGNTCTSRSLSSLSRTCKILPKQRNADGRKRDCSGRFVINIPNFSTKNYNILHLGLCDTKFSDLVHITSLTESFQHEKKYLFLVFCVALRKWNTNVEYRKDGLIGWDSARKDARKLVSNARQRMRHSVDRM